MQITTCPVKVVDLDIDGERACGQELQATRAEWMSGVTLELATGGLAVSDWGEHYDYAFESEDCTRFYCANDHTEKEIEAALAATR